jgi:tetratricopeptide (TPR) repeat protein
VTAHGGGLTQGRGAGGQKRPRAAPTKRSKGALPREIAQEIRAAAGKNADKVVRLFERATTALGRENFEQASRHAGEAKALAPRAGPVREILGISLYRLGRFREALRELQAYRRITGRPDQNHLIADAHRGLGAPEKAIPLVREALAARVRDEVRAEAAVVGAAALADLGRYQEALALLGSVASTSGSARPHDLRVWYVRADVLERAGRKREAAREFRRVLRHDPQAYDVAERLSRLS